MRDGRWEYTIRAYCPHNVGGGLAIETVHAMKASRDIELSAFRARMKRGEIARCEVIHHLEPFETETIYSTDPI